MADKDPGTAVTAPVQSAPMAAVAAPRFGLLRPIAKPNEIIAAQEETRQLVHDTLKEGRDYGKIPGIDKDTLLKPGAERITLGFGCFARFTVVEQQVDHDRPVPWRKVKAKWEGPQGNRVKVGEDIVVGESLGLYRYVVLCEIVHRESDSVVGSCIGTCSTMESKYIDRPRDCENTVVKMAQKRAHVGAVLIAFGLSEQFTQDVEDLPREVIAGADAADDDAVKCPKCQSPMYDNREKNKERVKEGKSRMPDYKCKVATCAEPIWDAAKYAEELARKTAPAAAAAPAGPAEGSLEWARQLPLPGEKSAWGGKGGQPMGELSVRMLQSVLEWTEQQLRDQPDSTTLKRLKKAADVLVLHAADKTAETPAASAAAPTPAPAARTEAPPAPTTPPDDDLPF